MSDRAPDYTPATIVARALIAAGVGSDPPKEGRAEWPIYISQMPPYDPNSQEHVPPECVAVTDTDPVVEGRLLATGASVRRWGVQLKARAAGGGEGYTAGWRKLVEAERWLERVKGVPVMFADARYFLIGSTTISGPMFMGFEEDTRNNLFTINLLVYIRAGLT